MMAISERDFQGQVIDLAHLFGWRVAHFRAAKQGDRWVTPVQADGAGFPDLVLVRDYVIFAELKSEKGTLGNEQSKWLRWLQEANAEYYLWRPSDWNSIEFILSAKRR